MTDKAVLRRSVREKIKALPEDYISGSNAGVYKAVTSLGEFVRAETILAYHSVGREVDTRRIIELALELGKKVALPVVLGGGEMEFALLNPDTSFRTGQLNIPEPDEKAERISPCESDLVLVPALCYDADGYRLGQGGGYYDRFLAWCGAYTVGLCRERLLMDRVPREIHDLPVKCLAGESGIIKKYRISRHL